MILWLLLDSKETFQTVDLGTRLAYENLVRMVQNGGVKNLGKSIAERDASEGLAQTAIEWPQTAGWGKLHPTTGFACKESASQLGIVITVDLPKIPQILLGKCQPNR